MVNVNIRTFAQENRSNPTEAEKRLWYFLRKRNVGGYKFRRQHVIDNYIVDFYCKEKLLIIEVDGDEHKNNKTYDEIRTRYLESKGFRVLRFWNSEVYNEIENVLELIAKTVAPPLGGIRI